MVLEAMEMDEKVMTKKRFIILAGSVIIIVCVVLFTFRGLILNKLVGNLVLKAGKPIKFGSYIVLIDRIENKNLYGIKISSKNIKIEAKSGAYEYIPKENVLKFDLINGVGDNINPKNPNMVSRLTFKEYHIKIRLESLLPK